MVTQMETSLLDGVLFTKLIGCGTAGLAAKVDEINALNVFPIPDGDTGENMYLTLSGGYAALTRSPSDELSRAAETLASGMLMSARGNSGVILSQLFAGIAAGFSGLESATPGQVAAAIRCGVERAYTAVAKPVEGTILTVARDAMESIFRNLSEESGLIDIADDCLEEMNASLRRTPELLPVLKQAGVVDSGGAGLLAILDGVVRGLRGEDVTTGTQIPEVRASSAAKAVDLDLFGSDDEMVYGYCTECLLRLSSLKTDVQAFDLSLIRSDLEALGDSMVLLMDGTVVKLHIHSMTPEKVLELMHRYGEFLTVKIENMTLQHHETIVGKPKPEKERKKFASVVVASGDGIKETFTELGADCIVDGGQSNNPSTEDFMKAFEEASADNIFVLPDNSNIILAAKQAAELWTESHVYVVPTKNIGEGYAVMSMLSYDSDDADMIFDEMCDAMNGVKTGTVSRAVRDAAVDGVDVRAGDYIGFLGKKILADEPTIAGAASSLLERMDSDENEFLIVIYGKSISEDDKNEFRTLAADILGGLEICEIDGGMDIYDMYLILQ